MNLRKYRHGEQRSEAELQAEVHSLSPEACRSEGQRGAAGAVACTVGGIDRDLVGVERQVDLVSGTNDCVEVEKAVAYAGPTMAAQFDGEVDSAFRDDGEDIATVYTDVGRLGIDTSDGLLDGKGSVGGGLSGDGDALMHGAECDLAIHTEENALAASFVDASADLNAVEQVLGAEKIIGGDKEARGDGISEEGNSAISIEVSSRGEIKEMIAEGHLAEADEEIGGPGEVAPEIGGRVDLPRPESDGAGRLNATGKEGAASGIGEVLRDEVDVIVTGQGVDEGGGEEGLAGGVSLGAETVGATFEEEGAGLEAPGSVVAEPAAESGTQAAEGTILQPAVAEENAGARLVKSARESIGRGAGGDERGEIALGDAPQEVIHASPDTRADHLTSGRRTTERGTGRGSSTSGRWCR